MNIIKPKVEWWSQGHSWTQHVAKVGRICYKTEGRQPSPDMTAEERESFIEERDKQRCEDFVKSGHVSMFRHGTAYFFIEDLDQFPKWLMYMLIQSPYVGTVKRKKMMFASCNLQFLLDSKDIKRHLTPYEVSEKEFLRLIAATKITKAYNLLRMTMVVTTQISTSRELNRTSPNNIAEQSTRYVKMQRKGGVQICRPHWYEGGTWWQRTLFRMVCRVDELVYNMLQRSGLKAEDARGVLPLDTYTVVAYTYNLYEWRQILDLRYHGTTGAPHPNAYDAASEIRYLIMERMNKYMPGFEI